MDGGLLGNLVNCVRAPAPAPESWEVESSSRCWWHRSGDDPCTLSGSVSIGRSPSWGPANVFSVDFGFILFSLCCDTSGTILFLSFQLTSGSLDLPLWISGTVCFHHVYCSKVKDGATMTTVSATKDSRNFKY